MLSVPISDPLAKNSTFEILAPLKSSAVAEMVMASPTNALALSFGEVMSTEGTISPALSATNLPAGTCNSNPSENVTVIADEL